MFHVTCEDERQRIERSLMNAQRFFWGVFNLNQPKIYDLLEKSYELNIKRGSYTDVSRQLLREVGIARIVEVAEDGVHRRFNADIIAQLRNDWYGGTLPSLDQFSGNSPGLPHFAGLLEFTFHKKDSAYIWNVIYWGEFAPILFEYCT